MRNWRTTIAALIAALPVGFDAIMQAYTAGAFTGKSGGQLLVSVALVLLGVYAKDHNVTGGTTAAK